jgi:hypothetical protein
VDSLGPVGLSALNSEYNSGGVAQSYPYVDYAHIKTLNGVIFHSQTTNVLSTYIIDNWPSAGFPVNENSGTFEGNTVSLTVGNMVYTNTGTGIAIQTGGGCQLSANIGSFYSAAGYFAGGAGTNQAGQNGSIFAQVGQFLGPNSANVLANCSFGANTTNVIMGGNNGNYSAISGIFTGNGGGLTNLQALSITGGTITNISILYRSTNITIGNLATSVAVIFSSPFPSWVGTNYSVTYGADGTLAAAVSPGTTSKTTNGFTMTVSTGISGGGAFEYMAIPYQ